MIVIHSFSRFFFRQPQTFQKQNKHRGFTTFFWVLNFCACRPYIQMRVPGPLNPPVGGILGGPKAGRSEMRFATELIVNISKQTPAAAGFGQHCKTQGKTKVKWPSNLYTRWAPNRSLYMELWPKHFHGFHRGCFTPSKWRCCNLTYNWFSGATL